MSISAYRIRRYSSIIEYLKEKHNCVPDCLSRYPVANASIKRYVNQRNTRKVKGVLLAYHNSSFNGSYFGKDRTF